MANVKVAGFTRKVKGKTVKVMPHTRTIKTKSGSRKSKPKTAAQKKKSHNWYVKNRTKIAAKRKLHH